MVLYVDIATGRIVSSPKLSKDLMRIDAKRGDAFLLTIVFIQNGKPVATSFSNVSFCAKPKSAYEGQAAVFIENMVYLSDNQNYRYTGFLNLQSSYLKQLLDNTESDSDDLVFIDLHAEVTWEQLSGSDQYVKTTNNVTLRVYNDVTKGDEVYPVIPPDVAFPFPDGLKTNLIESIDGGTIQVVGTLAADHIHGNLAGNLYTHVRAGENLFKGDPVYVSGSHGSGSSLIPVVSRAMANNAARMPAIGIMDSNVAANANGHMVIAGAITEINTSSYQMNQEVFVSSLGGITNSSPTSNSQVVGRVERVNTNNGAIVVSINAIRNNSWNNITDKPASFTPSSHSHGNITNSGTIGTTADLVVTTTTGGALTVVSRFGIDSRTSFPNADVTAATSSATPNTLVKRDADGGVLLFGNEAPGAYIGSIQDTGAVIDSGQGIGVFATSVSGLYHAFFGNTGSDRAFIARVNGAFGWFRGIFTGSIQAASALTANRTYILPDASGTLAIASTQAQTFLNALPASIPSAILNLDSSTQALKIPSMTETQRNAIASPVAGLILYNTTTNRPNFHNGTSWVAL